MKTSRTDQPQTPTASGKRISNRWVLCLCALVAGEWAAVPARRIIWPAGSAIAATNAPTPVVRRAERFDLSPPLRDIEPVKSPASFAAGGAQREIPLGRLRRTRLTAASDKKEDAPSLDPVVQSFAPVPKTPAPTTAFEGISNADNIAVTGFSVLPPDTNGDVGPDHYVQAVNILLKIFNKSGTTLWGPLPISTLFAGFGGPCETNDDGDPIVLYDHLADRWLISQFADVGPPSHQCIAISQTGDPTGAYFRYDFAMPNNKFNDYPKFGVWPDAYYMTDNQFTPPTFPFSGAGVFAFERDKMLIGEPASFIYFDLATLDPSIGGMLPADLDGPAPPLGTPNYFAYFTATEFGDPQGDGLRIFDFHVDFATPANSTFTEHGGSPLATAAFDPVLCFAFYECLPQPGTSVKLDSLADRLMFRLQYRNFGSHESLVTNHTVNAGAGKAGIRYYELRATPPGGAFVVNEQATYAPDGNHRWMGSAAMDSAGNLAVGYSVSGANLFPSIRYASRLASDPPGGLFQGEATLQKGGGSQTSPTSRWGDYSALSVDPVEECTFWYTQEYYATASDRGWQTKIGSFRLPGCIHDLAVVKISAKATVKGAGPVTAGVAVKIQNRSDHLETIDSVDLGDGVSSGLVRLNVTVVDLGVEVCQPAGVVLDGAKNAALFSAGAKVLKPKKKLTVNFLVTYQCANAQPLNKADPSRGDYDHVATVYHDVLDGNADTHAEDDSCPHDALPGNLDSNPPPKGATDKGCGAKKPDGTLGAPVQTDVIQ
jgi:hypothetical protein